MCCLEKELYFFDSECKYKYFLKRGRKPTELLPAVLKEVRSTGSIDCASKLDNFLHKQKRIPVLSESDGKIKTKDKRPTLALNDNLTVLVKESFTSIIEKNPEKEKKKKKKKTHPVEVDDNQFSSEDEDDNKFLFEEAKFSATTIVLQLGKLLDSLLKGRESTDFSIKNNTSKNIVWNYQKQEINISDSFVLPDQLIVLLSFQYEDLIKQAQYRKRIWQTEAYKDIIGTTARHTDSGIFSVPQTAMSGLYFKPDTADGRPCKKRSKLKVEASRSAVNNLQVKSSKDSGMTSDSDCPSMIAYKRESKTPSTVVPKPKTRYEKFYPNDNKVSSRGVANQKINVLKREQSQPEKTVAAKPEDIPNPPVSQQMISFAVSSRACHEKGWVVQPSFLQDPEHQTLLVWARARLQQAIKQKEDEEAKSQNKNVSVRFYGDSKIETAVKYKKGTTLAKKVHEQLDTKKKAKFLISLPDGSFTIFYPSGSIAVVSTNAGPGLVGNYTLVYGNEKENHQLLAHFTPAGRGVCYHKNGQIAFISMEKFGSCQDEAGALINKWKWSMHKLVPPLTFQLNSKMTFRCSNKNSMVIFVNIDGESSKVKLGICGGAEDPKVAETGSLLTMEKFSSQIAIQLSKSVQGRKKDKKNEMAKKGKSSQTNVAAPAITEDVLAQQMKELEIKFPVERKEVELNTPYQLELKALLRKFKTTVTNWMDYYRIATGITSPAKFRRKQCSHSAASLPGTIPSLKVKGEHKKRRMPSAPPIPQCYNYYCSNEKSNVTERCHSSAGDYASRADSSEEARRSPSPRLQSETVLPTTPSKTPFKCGLLREATKPNALHKEGCPIALRLEILGERDPQCRCDKRKVPDLTDIELDRFLIELPKTQLIVISVISSGPSSLSPASSTLDKLYQQLNKNRTFPCVQSRNDPYRLLRYSIPPQVSYEDMPLLVSRHNVVPGMFMMYQGGKILFADFIFDGYGNTKKDFLKQISRTRKEALKGRYLPPDFRFSPAHGRPYPQAPWSGNVGIPIDEYNMSSYATARKIGISNDKEISVNNIAEEEDPVFEEIRLYPTQNENTISSSTLQNSSNEIMGLSSNKSSGKRQSTNKSNKSILRKTSEGSIMAMRSGASMSNRKMALSKT